MKINRDEINPIKMSVNPPQAVVDAGNRVISNGRVYQYVGIGWVDERDATESDYTLIPELI